jgi:hypothetical protein
MSKVEDVELKKGRHSQRSLCKRRSNLPAVSMNDTAAVEEEYERGEREKENALLT